MAWSLFYTCGYNLIMLCVCVIKCRHNHESPVAHSSSADHLSSTVITETATTYVIVQKNVPSFYFVPNLEILHRYVPLIEMLPQNIMKSII